MRKGTWIPINEHSAKTFAEFLNRLEENQDEVTQIDIELTNNRRVEGVLRLKGHIDYLFGKWIGAGKEPEAISREVTSEETGSPEPV